MRFRSKKNPNPRDWGFFGISPSKFFGRKNPNPRDLGNGIPKKFHPKATSAYNKIWFYNPIISDNLLVNMLSHGEAVLFAYAVGAPCDNGPAPVFLDRFGPGRLSLAHFRHPPVLVDRVKGPV